MPGDHQHFPTFDRMRRAISPHSGSLAGWLVRNVFTERGLIRLALYALLLVCVVHATSILVAFGSLVPTGPIGYRGFPGLMDADLGGVSGFLLSITTRILGPVWGNSAALIAAVCLAGLAHGAKGYEGPWGGRWWSRGEALPRAEVTAGHLGPPEPIPPRAKEPPPRHPLDPDPDDLPLESPWPRRSHPST